jgi:HTH-type transcriptional regulator/antitoxin HigA
MRGIRIVHRARWKSSAELKAQLHSVSILTAERAVFNIKGNDYRLIASINYGHQILFVKWLGTHREYDRSMPERWSMAKAGILVRPIRTEADYRRARNRIEKLMSAEPGTHEGDELDVLATLVDAYEEKRFPMDAPDPVTAIQFRMEQQGLTRKDLEPMIGSRARVSEVMTGKRGLTLAMVRRVRSGLGISADLLVGTGKVRRRA